MKEVILTQEQLEERLAYWQEKLRLRDWIITASIKRMSQFSQPDRAGEVFSSYDGKEAAIKLLDPEDHSYGDGFAPYDMEHVLVHELLHLHTGAIKAEDEYSLAEEQAIESIVSGLIALERGA